MPSRRAAALACLAFAALNALTLPAAHAGGKGYVVRNLVSNGAVDADFTDPNMVNTWGVAFNPAGLVWVTNNRSGTSTLYDGLGVPNALVVAVPPAKGSGLGSPTGIVFSGTSDFTVTDAGKTGPSRFIFASEDGLISGWAPSVNIPNAIGAVETEGAIYMGLAIATSATGPRLYATDYGQAKVDVFDGAFASVTGAGRFVDPKMPKGMSPFGIQAIDNELYVTFIRQGDYKPHTGQMAQLKSTADSVISVFDTEGRFLRRAVAKSTLRQPWGLALAPAGFGAYSGRLLVSDFHEGTITAYDKATGAFVGQLKDRDGHELRVPGIWGMQFGNGINSQPLNTLFFGAGPSGQGGGVYGSITAAKP